MENIGWDDLQIFYQVANTGGLSSAARELGLSAPTVGRRMLSLELQVGQTLFERSQTGYRLTGPGESLMERVRGMQAAAAPIEQFVSSQTELPVVRLSAGTATAHFLADKFSALSLIGDEFRLNYVTTEAVLDIAHREVELGIRNRPADSGNLASRKLGLLRFAPYRNWSVPRPELLEWIAVDPDNARHPAARWLHEAELPIRAFASTVATVRELVRAGAGIGVMPCMIGDCDPTLSRAGPIIDELTETQYLVMHGDDRHQGPIRTVIERIVNIYGENTALLAGERPLRA